MQYLTGKDYPHLCAACRAQIDEIAAQMTGNDPAIEAASLAVKIPVNPSDPEAPCDFLYDHALFCGGRTCKGPWKPGDTIVTIYGKVITLREPYTRDGLQIPNCWVGVSPYGTTEYVHTENISEIVGAEGVSQSPPTLWVFYKHVTDADSNSSFIPVGVHAGRWPMPEFEDFAKKHGFTHLKHDQDFVGGYFVDPDDDSRLLCAPNGTDPGSRGA